MVKEDAIKKLSGKTVKINIESLARKVIDKEVIVTAGRKNSSNVLNKMR